MRQPDRENLMDRRRELSGLVAVAASPAPSAVPSASSTAPPPRPRPAQWVAAGSLNMGRSVTYAVKLTGGNVLVVGEDAACNGEGNSAGADSVKAEIYNATAGTWTTTGSLNAPRAYFAAEPLAGGRALVTAGVTDGGISYSSSKLYDSATGTWTATGLLHYARTSAAYALLNDGRVLVVDRAAAPPTSGRGSRAAGRRVNPRRRGRRRPVERRRDRRRRLQAGTARRAALRSGHSLTPGQSRRVHVSDGRHPGQQPDNATGGGWHCLYRFRGRGHVGDHRRGA